MTEELKAAVAAGVVGSEETFRSLLESVAEVARAIFGAKASSIFLLDEETDELVFEAIAGYGADTLLGQRFPSSTGIAGWVLVTRQPLVIEDVTEDPRFAKDFAEGTGYIPKGLMAVPLLYEERALGVLQVLDRPRRSRFTLQEMELLGLFGNQAAIATAAALMDRACDHLLADTTLTRDQHRARHGRHPPYEGDDFSHRARLTDHLVGAPLVLGAQELMLPGDLAVLEQMLDLVQ